jgi:hypothetical protein
MTDFRIFERRVALLKRLTTESLRRMCERKVIFLESLEGQALLERLEGEEFCRLCERVAHLESLERGSHF